MCSFKSIHSYSQTGQGLWTTNLQAPNILPFTQSYGPTTPPSSDPCKIFLQFFTDELLGYIVNESNRYAVQSMSDEQAMKWNDITIEELKAYFGFCILMGIVKLPSISDYWKKNPIFRYEPISSRVTRDRFWQIRRYLHFVDNTTVPPPGVPNSDRLSKVRPVVDYITNKCQTQYKPPQDLSVDEAMVKFQGRSSMKQYIPLKPIKRGIKVWVLACNDGYFWNMQVSTCNHVSEKKLS